MRLLRIDSEEESLGLDLSHHGGKAYNSEQRLATIEDRINTNILENMKLLTFDIDSIKRRIFDNEVKPSPHQHNTPFTFSSERVTERKRNFDAVVIPPVELKPLKLQKREITDSSNDIAINRVSMDEKDEFSSVDNNFPIEELEKKIDEIV